MSDLCWKNLTTAIHASARRAVLAITGGGSGAIGQLLQVPGGSQTVLEATVPYSSAALAEWLGTAADQSCSESTARAMAMASWMRARRLSPESDPHQLIGLGTTASLVSNRPKQGDHRVHVAAQTSTSTVTYSLVFAKDKRDRFAEETLTAQLSLLALATACQIDTSHARSSFEKQGKANEQIEVVEQQAEKRWTNLLLGDRSHICYPASFHPRSIFPGAFNPPHAGHHRIAQLASTKLGCPIAFELSITNVDKPPLDFIELNNRLMQLQAANSQVPLLLTDAPTFRKKSELFPGCTFVVGADTIARVSDPKYYSGATGSFDAAVQQIAERGCRFLVFGREINGKFCVLSDLTLPSALRPLCEEVSADEFREDVSSTGLRESRAASTP